MKFSKKTAHRLLMFLGMFAPIAYLFGSMFFGLAGAHGEEIYKDDVIVQRNDYDYLMQTENFSYGAFDWENEHGRHVGFSLGFLSIDPADDIDFALTDEGIGLNYFTYTLDSSGVINGGLGFSGSSTVFLKVNVYDWGSDVHVEVDESLESGGYDLIYFSFYFVDYDQEVVNAFVVEFSFAGYWSISHTYFYHHDFDPTSSWVEGYYSFGDRLNLYFDDGSHLPQGVEWDDALRSYFVPSVKAVSSDTYTASVFGQFFPRDNFLQKIGENALSETPVGFAPFSAMFRYLDSSVFHGSNSQIALMVYGEVYWSLHVVMADLVYHVLVWIPNLINRVFDWFDSKGLSDE